MSALCNTWSQSSYKLSSSEKKDMTKHKSHKLLQSPELKIKSLETSWLLTSDSDEVRDFSRETWYDPSESSESFYLSEKSSAMIFSSMSESDSSSRDSCRDYLEYPTTTSTPPPQIKGKTNSSSKRKRVATVQQREAANIRERRRMFNLNQAFNSLRKKVPTFVYERRLSRIETLRLAILYISFMIELLNSPHGNQSQINSQMMENLSRICAESHQD